MERIICKVYPSMKDSNFTFPELTYGVVDNSKIAFCLSGGGCRSMCVGIGILRSLLARNKDFLEKISYLSGVSGGGWLFSILSFANVPIHELLGNNIPLEELSENSVNNVNFECRNNFIGQEIVSFSIMDRLSDAMNCGTRRSKCFQYALARNFLDKYGISCKTIVLNSNAVELNKKYNKLECICPRENFPYLILSCVLIDSESIHEGTFPYEMTPMYSGCRVVRPRYGGFYLQNQGIGCYKTPIKIGELNNLRNDTYGGNACVESFMANTGAAYTEIAFMSNTLLGGFLETLAPKMNVWSEETQHSHLYDVADGAYIDNCGILSPLARSCPKIFCVISTEGVLKSSGNLCIANLFGIKIEDSYGTSKYKKNTHVFETNEWNSIYLELESKARNKTFTYFRRNLNVLRNEKIGINGNYNVDLLVVYVDRVEEFDKLLPESFDQENNLLGNYPNYPIMFSSPGDFLNMSRSHVNITCTYSSWYMNKLLELDDVSSFFV